MIVTYICVDTDHNVSTTYCCSSSGNSDNLLSMTTCITMVVSDWCVMNLAHGHYHLMKTSSTRLKRSDQLVKIVRKVRKETFIHIIRNQQYYYLSWHIFTLLMRRFWGLRSRWRTLRLWQKARPLSNWNINDLRTKKTLILTWFAKYMNDIAACTLTMSAAVYRKSFACQIPRPPKFRLVFYFWHHLTM